MKKLEINPGHKFGKLMVIREAERTDKRNRRFLCKCECGIEKSILINSLTSGDTKSCGCQKGNLKHGHRIGGKATPEYVAWESMQHRCYYTKDPSYKNYGGRGVSICEQWRNSFQSFLDHIGPKPNSEMSVDRIDNSRGYEPGNVKWATRKEQASNRRRQIMVEYRGEQILATRLAEKLNVWQGPLIRRLNKGLSLEESLIGLKPRGSRSIK